MAFVFYLIELLLPVTLTAGLFYWLSGILPLGNLNRTFALVVLAILLVVLSFIFSVVLDTITLPFRRRSANHSIFNRVDSRSRMVKFTLAGVVIPLGVFAAALLVRFPGPEPVVTLLLQPRTAASRAPKAVLIGDAVQQSTNPVTKIQGIKTLQTLPPADAQEQLLRLTQDDPEALSDALVSEALSKAIASYGVAAKPELLAMFNQVDPTGRKGDLASDNDLFQRYLSASIEGLKKEIADQHPDANLAGIDTAAAGLQAQLSQLQASLASADHSDPRLGFVLHTFLGMDIKEDTDLLALGKNVASDDTYSDGVRGQALLLVGKLGGTAELDGLYAAMQSESDLIRANALEAIGLIQAKAPDSSNK
jgi:hypothetical protein